MRQDEDTLACEEFQIELSAMIDGELESAELAPTIDHLVECSACRSFYASARAIDGLALQAAVPAVTPAAPEAVWQRIRDARGAEQRRRPVAVGWPAWAATAAASILLALGLSVVALDGTRPVDPPEPDAAVLTATVRPMNDQRFVELAREVLHAEPRYQREMLEAMRAAASRQGPREGTFEASYGATEDAADRDRTSERRTNDTRLGPRS